MKKVNELILRWTDRQIDKPNSKLEARKDFRSSDSYFTSILQRGSKRYIQFFSFSVLINVRNKFLGLPITVTKCKFFF